MSEEIQFTKQDYLDLAAGNVEVKVERHEHYHFGVEVDPIEPPDEEENGGGGEDFPYFKLQILRGPGAPDQHRVYTHPSLDNEWKENDKAVMAMNGMLVEPLEFVGEAGNKWLKLRPVELDAEGKLVENYKGWKNGGQRSRVIIAAGYLPFDLPNNASVVNKLQPGDLPG